MAQIIMGLDGLPSSVTVTATQYQPASNKKKHYGRLNLHVANAMGEVGKRVQYTHSSIYELEDMGNAICTFRTQWNTCTGMTVRDTIKAFGSMPPGSAAAVAGKQLTFTLSAGIANGVSDMIAQDDELYYGTVGTIG